MRYKDGRTYQFTFDGVEVEVELDGMTEAVIEKFNHLQAKEIQHYKSKGGEKQIA